MVKVLHFSTLLILFFSASVLAQIPPFYHQIAEKHEVPVTVVYALALTESNTRMNDGTAKPWPYTINLHGKVDQFLTAHQMVNHAESLKSTGRLTFDVGLFQVNWYWVGRHKVGTIRELADPYTNGDIAMETIKLYKTHHNTWGEAAGRYHNPANKNGLADIYEAKFNEHHARIIRQSRSS